GDLGQCLVEALVALVCAQPRRDADGVDLARQQCRAAFGRKHAELQAAGAGIEDQQGLHGATAVRLRCASSCAMAQDAVRVWASSARLVSTMGTRAPSTMPDSSALARYSSCLATMLPDSMSGTTRMSAWPAHA